jgi:hypothetical protein
MGFFKKIVKKITQSVVAATIAPVVGVVAVGYAVHKTNQYVNKKVDAELDRGYRNPNNSINAQKTGYENESITSTTTCSSAIPAEVAAVRSQAENYDRRVSIFQAGLENNSVKSNPYYKCSISQDGNRLRTQIPTMRTTQALCASSMSDQKKYLNQSKDTHDQMYGIIKESKACNGLAEAADSLAPLKSAEGNTCKIDPAVAEVSADADRTWDGMKKLEELASKTQLESDQALARYKSCRLVARARGRSANAAGCKPVKNNMDMECLKAANLNGPLNKIRGLSRAVSSCRSNYEQEYSDLVKMKEYEAGFRLAMSGMEICEGLSSKLANAPVPARNVASVPQELPTAGSENRSGAATSNAVK